MIQTLSSKSITEVGSANIHIDCKRASPALRQHLKGLSDYDKGKSKENKKRYSIMYSPTFSRTDRSLCYITTSKLLCCRVPVDGDSNWLNIYPWHQYTTTRFQVPNLPYCNNSAVKAKSIKMKVSCRQSLGRGKVVQ